MILSDTRIFEEIENGSIKIVPYSRECLGSNSYDVHLGKFLATYTNEELDAKKHNTIEHFEIPEQGIVLYPHKFYLGVTEEYPETHAHVPFLEGKSDSEYSVPLYNIHISRCYNCEEIAIWLGEGMVWPHRGSVPRPNADIPTDALGDYEEAAEIVDKSPRGAAALLRLAIQKICIELGGKGHLNDDISMLVERGLDKRVQQ